MKKFPVIISFAIVLVLSASAFAEDITISTVMPTILRAKKGAIGTDYFSSVTLPNATIPSGGLVVEGNVGIGTIAPGQKLSVTDSAANYTAGIYNTLGDATGYGLYVQTRWNVADNFVARFVSNSGAQEIMALKGSGNVGIGTVTPAERLEVANSIRVTADANKTNHDLNALTMYAEKGNFSGGNKIGFRFATDCNVTNNDEIWIGPYGLGQMGHIQLTATDIHLNSTRIWFNGTDVTKILDPSYSDITLKKDIVTIPSALDRVCALRGVNFHWKDKNSPQSLQMGVIGQEVEKVFPEVVTTGTNGKKSVKYERLVGALIEAIKAQQKEINSLKAEVRK